MTPEALLFSILVALAQNQNPDALPTKTELLAFSKTFLADTSSVATSLCCHDAVDLVSGATGDASDVELENVISATKQLAEELMSMAFITLEKGRRYKPRETSLVVLLDTGPMVMDMLEYQDPKSFSLNTWLFEQDGTFNATALNLDVKSHLFGLQSDPDKVNASRVWELYKISPGVAVVENLFAHFRLDNRAEVELLQSENIWERRKDLNGHEFKVCYKENFPYITLTNGEHLGGLFYDILLLMSESANFSTQLQESDDGTFGSMDPDTGEWSGMIGMVARNVSDFSISDISVTQERSQVVDFTAGLFTNVNKLFMKKPGLDYKWTTFIDVFDHFFWLAMLGACIASLLALGIFFKIVTWNEDAALQEPGLALGVVLAAFTALDVEDYPRRAPTRGLLLSVLICGSLCFWAYNAGLVSQLSVEIISHPIANLEDVLASPDYHLIVEDGTAYLDYFRQAKEAVNPTAYNIWNEELKKDKESIVKNVLNMESTLLGDPFGVYFGPDFQTQVQMPRFPCKIISTAKAFFAVSLGLPFQKDSPFLPLFNHLIGQIKERGHDQKLLKTILDQKTKLDCEVETGYRSIDYKDIFTAFLLLAVGTFVSVLITCFELLIKKHRRGKIPNERLIKPSMAHFYR